MATNELHLDELTYARAERLAKEKNVSVEELVSDAIERYTDASAAKPAPRESMIGLFADAPELMDQIVEEAYLDRETAPHRLNSE